MDLTKDIKTEIEDLKLGIKKAQEILENSQFPDESLKKKATQEVTKILESKKK